MADRTPRTGERSENETRALRNLRRLVTVLTLTLIAGVITTVGLLVIRLNTATAPVALPPAVSLPAGESARAVTLGKDWVALVTEDEAGRERIRVLDRASGAERAVTEIAPLAPARQSQ